MKLKTLIVIVGILAALSVVAFIARRPAAAPAADTRVGQPLIASTQIEKAARLRISDQGKTVVLHRLPDGSWRVESYHDLPADFSKLSQWVNSLSDATLTRFVSARPEILSRLEFKDSRIELLDQSGQEIWSATLGKTGETGGRYLRFGTEPKAYLAALNVWLDTESKNWADSRLLALKPEDVSAVEIPFADRSVVLSRAKTGDAWSAQKTPDGQQVSAAKVSSLLSNLTQLRFTDTNELSDEKALAAKTNARAFTLKTFDGKSYTVALGRKPEEKKLKTPAATAGASPDFTKNSPVNPDGTVKPIEPAKPDLPEFETIPAGPVFAFISASDPSAAINALMQKRAFQIGEYAFTSLPQNPSEIFEPQPPSAPAAASPTAPAKKP
jgi:hypothetical protein